MANLGANANDFTVIRFNQGGNMEFYARAATGADYNMTESAMQAYKQMTVSPTGVGIGTASIGTNKLAVEGTIGARKVVVTVTNPFPDYVFKPAYELPSLDSVAAYIRINGIFRKCLRQTVSPHTASISAATRPSWLKRLKN